MERCVPTAIRSLILPIISSAFLRKLWTLGAAVLRKWSLSISEFRDPNGPTGRSSSYQKYASGKTGGGLLPDLVSLFSARNASDSAIRSAEIILLGLYTGWTFEEANISEYLSGWSFLMKSAKDHTGTTATRLPWATPCTRPTASSRSFTTKE